jgi:hypothetical protein
MDKLRQIIREIAKQRNLKPDCGCGCSGKCGGEKAPMINENLSRKPLLSEHLQYHVDNKKPLTENTFRYGSQAFLDLWAEARYLYSRNVIHLNEDDKSIILETNLGEYGMFEGKKVPLDMPLLEEEDALGDKEDIEVGIMSFATPFIKNLKIKADKGDKKAEKVYDELVQAITPEEKYKIINTYYPEQLNEAEKKKNPPLNKPKRGGSKKFYVYVRKPGGGIKKVSFGQAGMSAKINNPEARRAFAARHKCAQKTDKTKASYWSCRLPRYASLLGLKSNFSGFW